jgi:solute carrier family 35 protein F5
VSAILYAAYSVLIRKEADRLGSEKVRMAAFFGILGLQTVAALGPVLLVTSSNWAREFTVEVAIALTVNGLLNSVLSDLLWAKAMVLTSPTVATVGLSLTVPLAILADWMRGSLPQSPLVYTSAAMVLIGFGLLNSEPSREQVPAYEDFEDFPAGPQGAIGGGDLGGTEEEERRQLGTATD